MKIQNIGLMMVYNEEDIIEETMDSHKHFFEKILVLDGSDDKTPEIIRSYDNVVYYLHEKDIFPKRKIRDGVRQFLLEKAQEKYGYDGWFTLLHGDELFVDNPNDIALKAEKSKAEKVNWHMLSFFLHNDQKNQEMDFTLPNQERLIYYALGGLEIRQFKNKPNIFYNLNQHGNLLPHGIGLKPLLDFPVIKHYVNRSPDQIFKRLSNKNRMVNGGKDFTFTYDQCFQDEYYQGKHTIRKYDGSFHELEPGKRPNFLKQLYSLSRY